MSIGNKMTTWLLAITVIPWMLVTSVIYFSLVRSFEENAGQSLKIQVQDTSAAIDRFMIARTTDLKTFSNSPIFSVSRTDEISKHLLSIVEAYPFYDELSYVDTSGIVIASSNKDVIGKKFIELHSEIREELEKAVKSGSEDVYISDLSDTGSETVAATDKLEMQIISDVRDASGYTRGALVGFVNINQIIELVHHIDDQTIGDEYAYLVDDPGNVLITADPNAQILQPHKDLGVENLQAKLEGDENGYVIYENTSGRKVITAYADLGEYGQEQIGDWSLLSTAPYDDIMQPAYEVLTKVIGIALAMIVGIIIFIIMFVRRAISSDQVAAYAQHIGNVAGGNLSQRLNVKGSDELSLLGSLLDNMTDSLSEIVSNVQKSGIKLTATSTTMAATTKEQEASVREAEATTNQIVASTHEIAVTSRELVSSMDAVAHAVDDTASLAEKGRGGLGRMGSTIRQMMEASKNISKSLLVLNEKASNITSVVTTITKVADQTNLLSVNAAIEADKAGEHGIGFGTVATEIRRLADQTAVATWEIKEMVKEVQSAVSASVMGMDKFSDEVRHGVDDVQEVGQQLTQIIERVQSLGPHFEVVHVSAQSQSDGAGQINEALIQLGETMSITGDAVRQANKMVDELNEESARMRAAISMFDLGSDKA